MARSRTSTRRAQRSNPKGVLVVHPDGYGFANTAEGEFFIPASKMNGAFDGDTVELARLPRRGGSGSHPSATKPAARILRVLERAHTELIGRYHAVSPFGIVVPEDPRIPYDIFTKLSDNPDIPDDALVRVTIVTYPSRREAATGVISEVLDTASGEHVAIDLIVAHHKLRTAFPDAATAQAREARVDAEEALAAGYTDLTSRFIVTIDPADARDFDDAVSLAPAELPDGSQGWRVGVHIADVSHYVPWDSPLDVEARQRATSVYLADRVIPMLPAELSDDVCSLREGEMRRTLTVDMLVDNQAVVRDVRPYPAVICSAKRLSYGEAQEVLQGGMPESVDAELAPILSECLQGLSSIAKQRVAARERAGGIDFDTVEAKVRLDELGAPIDVDLRVRTDATQLIEEAMIMANESVAAFLRDAQAQAVYRVHEAPAHDSLESITYVFGEYPWFKQVDATLFAAGNSHQIARALELSAGRPEQEMVTALILRAMKRAIYTPELAPHYALASDAYLHFTSPIRRYPDLLVHRAVKAVLFGRPEKFNQEEAQYAALAAHASEMERVAETAARESQEVKLIELMESQVGEVFSATVSGVTGHSLYVRLENTVEGTVDLAHSQHEYFMFDPLRHTLTGSETGRMFRLGQLVAVRLVEADSRLRILRFTLV